MVPSGLSGGCFVVSNVRSDTALRHHRIRCACAVCRPAARSALADAARRGGAPRRRRADAQRELPAMRRLRGRAARVYDGDRAAAPAARLRPGRAHLQRRRAGIRALRHRQGHFSYNYSFFFDRRSSPAAPPSRHLRCRRASVVVAVAAHRAHHHRTAPTSPLPLVESSRSIAIVVVAVVATTGRACLAAATRPGPSRRVCSR